MYSFMLEKYSILFVSENKNKIRNFTKSKGREIVEYSLKPINL
jgi:hypothetical protein